ncbi:MAG: TIGR00289 family protein [Archaeoglobaceae archaeon]|nr:TIGR00289 family protein [Archaeoglobaceae archaeon]MDW8128494.1 TIGR00289 family protein [Archaeoglobaceae archaeon]
MRVAVLTSGGKDSILALHRLLESQRIDKKDLILVGAYPKNPESYMFHTVNLHMLDAVAKCLELPLKKIEVSGEEEKEVFELENELSKLKLDAVCIGAIASLYQFKRVERTCKKLGLKLFAPLWGEDQEKILREIADKFEAIMVSVSAMGLDESFLGRRIDEECIEALKRLNRKYGVNLAGEGGEYESLVLNAPLFRKKINLRKLEKLWFGNSGVAIVKDYEIVDKDIF